MSDVKVRCNVITCLYCKNQECTSDILRISGSIPDEHFAVCLTEQTKR